MGEGWSDFYGIALLSAAGDDVNGSYAAGAYACYQLSGMTTNYYYGIRRYPYSTYLAKNPLTFKDIDSSQASAHIGVPLSPRYSSSNSNPSEVHGQGEVWCVTLWEARANLINKHGWTVGNQLIVQLVTDGIKLGRANPSFLQARDAILQADLVNNAGASRSNLWAAFAKRGMGAYATSPSSTTTSGVGENFDLPDDLTGRVSIYSFLLDTNPIWTTQGQWAFGTPTGGGGTARGRHDPTSGATGTKVFGVNLTGDYSTIAGGQGLRI